MLMTLMQWLRRGCSRREPTATQKRFDAVFCLCDGDFGDDGDDVASDGDDVDDIEARV